MVETVSPREQLTSPGSSPNRNSPSSPCLKNCQPFLKNSAFEQIFSSGSKKMDFGLPARKFSDGKSEGKGYDVFGRKILESAHPEAVYRMVSGSPESDVYSVKPERSPSPRESTADRFDGSFINFRKSNDGSGDFRLERAPDASLFRSNGDELFHRDNFDLDVRKSQLFVSNMNESSPRSMSSSFSIDNILARGSGTNSQGRVTGIFHPGLHLGHLAAAAASGFGTSSADFLGNCNIFLTLARNRDPSRRKRMKVIDP